MKNFGARRLGRFSSILARNYSSMRVTKRGYLRHRLPEWWSPAGPAGTCHSHPCSVDCRRTPLPEPLLIARNASSELLLLPALANRHGLITGATGTGQTVSLQVMAERFSSIGVPVFLADVTGDLEPTRQP